MQKSTESAPWQSAPDVIQAEARLHEQIPLYCLAVFGYESCEACDSPIWAWPTNRA